MADQIVACMQDGDLKTMRRYIDELNSINEYVYEDEDNQLNVLHLAVGLDSKFREEVVELLVSLRADVNYAGKSEGVDGVRPLHLAAMWGYDTTLKLLIYHGADASLRDSKNFSPVDYASVFDNYLCISLLIRYGSLNSTATAWSAIMDHSLGDSEHNSTIEDCLYTTALDFGGDEHNRSMFKHSKFFNDDFINTTATTTTATMASPDNKLDTVEHSDSNSNTNDNNETKSDDNDKGEEEEEDDDPLALITDDEIDLNMDNLRLRMELRKLGRNPGPITQTTKKLYAKLLARLAKEDKELVYSPRTTTKSSLNGYSLELNSILTGKFPTKQALELEREFILISGTKDYHGPKQFFNYILIDPRISRNLPEQALDASDSDTSRHQSKSPDETNPKHAMRRVNRKFNPRLFTKFLQSIFYIGKGQKKRDFIHLYDALADRDSITYDKIERIRSIWADGFGVVSLHLFHNITSKEALTREALMIETIGLNNLTNLIKGSIQFKLGWNDHKRKLLGALLLHRAYQQLLNEGERQLKREDLKI